jgi:gas vesicle protein
MNSNLKKGLLTGGIIGGALAALFMSKKGKELRKEGLKYAAELYKELEKKAEKITDFSQEKYEELVELLVSEYGKKKELAEEVKDQIVLRLKAQWEHLEVEGLLRKIEKEFTQAATQTKEAFEEITDTIVEKYAEEKKMGQAMKRRLEKEIMERYEEIKKEVGETKKKGN